MSLLLAPYNNAMRLGQGFNSYIQQICVDDAVVVDPQRAENIITNDGTTMRIVAQTTAKPSAWTRQDEVVVDQRAKSALVSNDALAIEDAEAEDEQEINVSDSKEDIPDAGNTDVVVETAAQSLPAAQAEVEKSETDSIENIEHNEIEDSRPNKPSTSGIKGKSALPKPKHLRASELRRQKEAERKRAQEKEENERLAEQRAYQKEIDKEKREEERIRRAEARAEEAKIREEKRIYDAQRREENRQALKKAAEDKANALTLADLDKIKAQNQFVERFNGMSEDGQTFSFDATAPRGPSQTVIYTSRFVDKLSDVTSDMSVSGALSIKASKIAGSGRGSFVDSDKFKESDLNFYISVKVVNQTLNFKDALVYNPLRSVDQGNFLKIYGDSFISGFLEGGEFNALVSMKILNKAKLTDIKAEAKVAFTAGPVDITAEANVGIARSNIETNTETTIQVSWCGGGHIKPMEQQWDIKSLMQAAARFPDLVADCPQRTYAILTKYETLRSFVARQPASYTPLQYENAQIYTNALMDSFLTYKSIYKRLGEQIFNIQGKILEIIPWEGDGSAANTSTAVTESLKKDEKTGLYPYVEDLSRFEASLKGLSDARKAIRRQMMRIVNEVDLMEKDPKLATDEDHQEPFQSPVTFETRLPQVQVPLKLQQKTEPLSGKRIMAKTQTEEEQKQELAAQEEAEGAPALYTADEVLSMDEKTTFDKLKDDKPFIGEHLRVSSAVGAEDKGVAFSNLNFLQPDWEVQSIKIEIARGAIAFVEVTYENGLVLRKGKTAGGFVKELNSFTSGERVTYASLEYGELPQEGTRILAIRLYTNHGRRLLAQAAKNEVGKDGTVTKDGVVYNKVKSVYIDSPLTKGTFRGFFGRTDDSGFVRLGLIWGDLYGQKAATTDDESGPNFDYNDGVKTLTTVAQAGKTASSERWSINQPDMADNNPVKFNIPYTSNPRMISGITAFETNARRPIKVHARHENVTPTGFEMFTRTFGGATNWAITGGWMALPENDMRIETGVMDTYQVPRINNNQTTMLKQNFSRAFDGPKPPTVVCWLYEVSLEGGWHSLTAFVPVARAESFDLCVGTWANRTFTGARMGWMAFDDNACKGRIKTGQITMIRNDLVKQGKITFEGTAFSKAPAVFMALYEFDAGEEFNLRLTGSVSNVSTTGFDYSCGTWASANDQNIDHAKWVWIAME